MLWLKNNVSLWYTVVEKWKCTFSQRYNNLLKNVDEKKTYFDEFPPIKGAQGFMLVSIDNFILLKYIPSRYILNVL